MMRGSETWVVREENVRSLVRTEMRIVRWMCVAYLDAKHRVTDDELRDRLGPERISAVMRSR